MAAIQGSVKGPSGSITDTQHPAAAAAATGSASSDSRSDQPTIYAIRCSRKTRVEHTKSLVYECLRMGCGVTLNVEDRVCIAATRHDGSWLHSTKVRVGDLLVYTSKQAANAAAVEAMQWLMVHPPKGFALTAAELWTGDFWDEGDETNSEGEEEEEEEGQQQQAEQEEPTPLTADGRASLQRQCKYWIDNFGFKSPGSRLASTLKVEVVQAVVGA